ncbi:hypothetical protein ATCC90586_008201 [Pythium insidiosum]|nr:hypothetical protein ATCC90586_008201 [Pythium insidiosum]
MITVTARPLHAATITFTEDKPGPATPQSNDKLCALLNLTAFDTPIQSELKECSELSTFQWGGTTMPTTKERLDVCRCTSLMEKFKLTKIPRCVVVMEEKQYVFKTFLEYLFAYCDDPTTPNVIEGGTVARMWDDPVIVAMRIPIDAVTFGPVISRGGYGEVYRGEYRGETVAIKRLLPERRKDLRQIQAFLGEVKMMAGMEHDRIVRFVGVAWSSLSDLCVVSEFMERGDLRSVLNDFEDNQHRPHGFDADKVKIALHVAHALTYLHSLQPVIVHRDLKSKNILLTSDYDAKVTDFGVSRERADSTMTAGVGSSLWMAPEVMLGERYDERADVFSFGVVLSELDTHMLPYAQAKETGTNRKLPETAVLQMVSLGRLSVSFSSDADPELVALGRECVRVNARERPSSSEVLHRVHTVWSRSEKLL